MNRQQLIQEIYSKGSYLCVGLDTDVTKLPLHLQSHPHGVFEFNKQIIDATKDHCVSYKINTAFFEAMGVKGWEVLQRTVEYIPATHFTIADAKRGDIGNTSAQYAKTFFEVYGFDAVTVAPYMGEDSIRPFLEYEDKVTIVLGLTSNKGSEDFEQLLIHKEHDPLFDASHLVQGPAHEFLYERVLKTVASWGSVDNLMFVVGATKVDQLEHIRNMLPEHFFLVPGVGAQGGSLEEVSKVGLNKDAGLLVNASRAVIYASGGEDFAEAAQRVAKEYSVEMKQQLEVRL
ncbi:orotidine-5'-phosphate decarboxylase [Aridibaculum aurantiacum]|uniref:orotidine-5'-phosphate decarboxylase n=1 Tax=Aridibaculum aurantiacum TaxID=2810307 RepID=UPI001A96949C|nr:orotidine-5'-phosphate decarboxylase [Aridibaculum aurantiacum]